MDLNQLQATFLPRLLGFIYSFGFSNPGSGPFFSLFQHPERGRRCSERGAAGHGVCCESARARGTTGTRSCETNPLGDIKFKDSPVSSGSLADTNCWKMGKETGKVSQGACLVLVLLSEHLCQRLNMGLAGLGLSQHSHSYDSTLPKFPLTF